MAGRHKEAGTTSGCPCGSRDTYAQCCKRLHDGEPAGSAEALMRARYSAYALQRVSYLLRSWDVATRPPLSEADLEPATRWLGLRVVSHEPDPEDADAAVVEFVARYRVGGGSAQRLHERSRFCRRDGHWFYIDGRIIESE